MHSVLFAILVSLFVTQVSQPQAIPAQFVDGRVIVSATVNGKPMLLHLDSGTADIVLDTGAAREAGLAVANETATAEVDVGAYHAAGVQLYVAPYDPHVSGMHVSGILGSPFFESNVVTIDYPNKRVIVTPRAAFDTHAMHAQPTQLVELYHGLASVPVWFGNIRATMLLDTGAMQTMAFRPLASRLGLNFPQRTMRACSFGARCTTIDEYTAGPIVVGTTEFRQAVIGVPSQPLLSTKYYDGILGRDVLQQFAVTFDYADNAVYFGL